MCFGGHTWECGYREDQLQATGVCDGRPAQRAGGGRTPHTLDLQAYLQLVACVHRSDGPGSWRRWRLSLCSVAFPMVPPGLMRAALPSDVLPV